MSSRAWIASALALAASVAGCGGDEQATTTIAVTVPAAQHEQDQRRSAPTRPQEPPERVKPSRPRSLNTDAPRDGYPVVWVRVGAEVEVRAAPSADAELLQALDRRTEYGSPTVLGVVKRAGAWGAVETPKLGNGELGWVRLDRARLRSGYTNVSVSVDLSDRTAALRVDRRVVRSFAVTVGAPGTETPTGRFAVTDTFRGDLNPAYGCCALALTATQPHLPSGWLGGNRIAIHGTSGPLGVAASHGCVRAANDDVSALIDRVPLGAPVFIRG